MIEFNIDIKRAIFKSIDSVIATKTIKGNFFSDDEVVEFEKIFKTKYTGGLSVLLNTGTAEEQNKAIEFLSKLSDKSIQKLKVGTFLVGSTIDKTNVVGGGSNEKPTLEGKAENISATDDRKLFPIDKNSTLFTNYKSSLPNNVDFSAKDKVSLYLLNRQAQIKANNPSPTQNNTGTKTEVKPKSDPMGLFNIKK